MATQDCSVWDFWFCYIFDRRTLAPLSARRRRTKGKGHHPSGPIVNTPVNIGPTTRYEILINHALNWQTASLVYYAVVVSHNQVEAVSKRTSPLLCFDVKHDALFVAVCVDGHLVDVLYTNWLKNHPEYTLGCVAATRYNYWISSNCTLPRPFICQS